MRFCCSLILKHKITVTYSDELCHHSRDSKHPQDNTEEDEMTAAPFRKTTTIGIPPVPPHPHHPCPIIILGLGRKVPYSMFTSPTLTEVKKDPLKTQSMTPGISPGFHDLRLVRHDLIWFGWIDSLRGDWAHRVCFLWSSGFNRTKWTCPLS